MEAEGEGLTLSGHTGHRRRLQYIKRNHELITYTLTDTYGIIASHHLGLVAPSLLLLQLFTF